MITIGVLGDSHIPYRLPDLPEGIDEILQDVDILLHTGDVCRTWVLRKLESLAPVLAVRGNNDYFFPRLPLSLDLSFNGVPVVLTHSHGGFLGNLYERVRYFTRGYTYQDHYARVIGTHLQARVIVFGHTHLPVCEVRGSTLLFNPGSLGPAYFPKGSGPKIGRIFIDHDIIRGEVIELADRQIISRVELETNPGMTEGTKPDD
jgi:uncharacterized protein